MRYRVAMVSGGSVTCKDEKERDQVLSAHAGAAWAVPLAEEEESEQGRIDRQAILDRIRSSRRWG